MVLAYGTHPLLFIIYAVRTIRFLTNQHPGSFNLCNLIHKTKKPFDKSKGFQ